MTLIYCLSLQIYDGIGSTVINLITITMEHTVSSILVIFMHSYFMHSYGIEVKSFSKFAYHPQVFKID